MKKNFEWTKRLRNKSFWLSLVAALLLLVQSVAALFGYQWDFSGLGQQLSAVINAVFSLLAVLGVISDPSSDWMEGRSNDGE